MKIETSAPVVEYFMPPPPPPPSKYLPKKFKVSTGLGRRYSFGEDMQTETCYKATLKAIGIL